MPALVHAMRKLGGKPVSETNAEAQTPAFCNVVHQAHVIFLLFARRVDAHLSDDESVPKMDHPALALALVKLDFQRLAMHRQVPLLIGTIGKPLCGWTFRRAISGCSFI
jgi:hypothetical protein